MKPNKKAAAPAKSPKKDLLARAAKTMKGDLVNFVLDQLRHRKRVWADMLEGEQREVIKVVDGMITEAITRAVNIIAADDRPAVTAHFGGLNMTNGKAKATLTFDKTDPMLEKLVRAQNSMVSIVVPKHAQFMGGKEPMVDKDQKALFDQAQKVKKEKAAKKPKPTPLEAAANKAKKADGKAKPAKKAAAKKPLTAEQKREARNKRDRDRRAAKGKAAGPAKSFAETASKPVGDKGAEVLAPGGDNQA